MCWTPMVCRVDSSVCCVYLVGESEVRVVGVH